MLYTFLEVFHKLLIFTIKFEKKQIKQKIIKERKELDRKAKKKASKDISFIEAHPNKNDKNISPKDIMNDIRSANSDWFIA